MGSHDNVIGWIRRILDDESHTAQDKTLLCLRLLAKHRSDLIANTLLRDGGPAVRSGPFAGLVLPGRSAEGCRVPKLLGTYEQELHPVLEELPGRGYEAVVDIGCAEGYYAVGLARLLPDVTVYAYDVNEKARQTCRNLAETNGVAARVKVGTLFRHEDFESFSSQRTLVICDIEGGETALLDPQAAAALAGMDILVELHDCFDRSISERVLGRFGASHRHTIYRAAGRDIEAFRELADFAHLDQLLAFWEWRSGPTPWAFLRANALSGAVAPGTPPQLRMPSADAEAGLVLTDAGPA